MAIAGAGVIAAMATVPLQPREQALFAVATGLLFLLANRIAGRGMTMLLMALSLAVSVRYLFWRIADTLPTGGWAELSLGIGLVIAELYATAMLLLGYMQTVWPLARKPRPLPADPRAWPTVDVFIPTYNEPLSLVRATVLAAMSMDYPPDKLAVHLLDDGARDEFRRFAEDAGCGYLARPDNRHAKAGNLNAAMARTGGEFIVVLDCDHIPTRAFLQMTLGWLVADPRLAVVQTPQHFYAPDPFQRNLPAGPRVPPEGNLFHGLIQDGRDFWDAALFTGSGAVLRRRALEDVRGFATETVTEDAHTTLKLHRKGWRSAFVRLPLAAGLAPERLARHIRQRQRWARGMLQILRIDNPLFGRGLGVGQRLCHLQATCHFLFAVPRVAFLTAPLAFLLFGQTVIAASPLAITAYALPHLFHAIATNARLHRNWRHSFWGEIYETVVALFLIRVTLAALLLPGRGRFDVTAKGGRLDRGFFDLRAVWPNVVLALLLALGIARAIVGMAMAGDDATRFDALAMNAIWASVSLLILLAALAVGRETRQGQSATRVAATLPCVIRLPDGSPVPATTIDLSQSGADMRCVRPYDLPSVDDVLLEVAVGDEALSLPARVVRWDDRVVQLAWQPTTLLEEAEIVRLVFGRADAWTDWASYPDDKPLVSLWRVVSSIKALVRPRDPAAAPPPADEGQSGGGDAETTDAPPASTVAVPAPVRIAAATAAGLLLALLGTAALPGQSGKNGITVRVIPRREPPITLGGHAPSSPLSNIQIAPLAPVAASPLAAPAGPPPAEAVAVAPIVKPPVTRRLIYTLRQLGAPGPLKLTGARDLLGVDLGLRPDEVVRSARLMLSGTMSPSLIREESGVAVTLNGHPVGAVPAGTAFATDLPIAPDTLLSHNRLEFHFTGHYAKGCRGSLGFLLWATVDDTSALELTVERRPPERDLARLPQPLVATGQSEALTLPFLLAANPSDGALRAAGIAASWFGTLGARPGASFPVGTEAPAEGNAVAIIVGPEAPSLPGLPTVTGPMLALVANPRDPLGSVLVIAGRNAEEAAAAATALATGAHLRGSETTLLAPPVVARRQPYDAPNWIAANRPVRLGELADAASLRSPGDGGLLDVPFRTAPDLVTWRDRPFALHLRYKAPNADVAAPRLDVGVNGLSLAKLPLAPGPAGAGWLGRMWPFIGAAEAASAWVGVPVYDVAATNHLQFRYDTGAPPGDACAPLPDEARLSLDPDSTIDLSHGYRFATLPNLAYFAGSGFPFTRMADLSGTAIVLPARPDAGEIGAFLGMMGRFGAWTGTPSLRVAVARPDGIGAVADRDLLVIATSADLGAAGALLHRSALTVAEGHVTLAPRGTLAGVRHLFDAGWRRDRERATTMLAGGIGDATAVLTGAASPLGAGRSVVAMLASAPQALGQIVGALGDEARAPLVQGDLAVLSDEGVASFRVTGAYTVGRLPVWAWPAWYFRDDPLALLGLLLVGCALLGGAVFRVMQGRGGRRE